MTDSATINWGACTQDEHHNSQGQQEELDVLLLDFGEGEYESEGCVFHGSPFYEQIGYCS